MSADTDLNLLKGVVQSAARDATNSTRFKAEKAVSDVLTVLYENTSASPIWMQVYDVISRAYVEQPKWGNPGSPDSGEDDR